MKPNDYIELARREASRWPGASITHMDRNGAHTAIVVHLNGCTRKIFIPRSPGDAARGHLNMLRDLRRALRTLKGVKQ